MLHQELLHLLRGVDGSVVEYEDTVFSDTDEAVVSPLEELSKEVGIVVCCVGSCLGCQQSKFVPPHCSDAVQALSLRHHFELSWH